MLMVGSLFAGIGGFDLGFERVGMRVAWQCENDKFCNRLLEAKWPKVKRYGDITQEAPAEAVDVICGGDPCPTRSLAKGNRKSRHPDLAGYFLAVAGRLRPRWVVRENVPSPDALHFAAALDLFGYGVHAFALDARDFTSQSRRRQIIVGCPPQRTADFRRALSDAADGAEFSASHAEETTPIAACVTAHPARMAAEDSYVWEPCTDAILARQPPAGQETGNYIFEPATYCLCAGHGHKGETAGRDSNNYLYDGGRLRVLTPEECEGLQGFPRGWTAGFSRSRRRTMLGNAIPVPFAEFVGRLILEVDRV